jgi:enoyl-CoA hydratase
MSYNNLTYEIENRINIISINRPEKLNALNIETFSEIDHAIKSSVANDEVRIIILTGVGEKAFVAGADIKEFVNFTMEQGSELSESGHKILSETIEGCPKPIIAAINGYALGGGLELAMACHIRVASENSKMGLPEVSLGVIPGYGGTQRLPQLVGKGRALDMILTAKMIDADEALAYGLINYMTDQTELMDFVKNLSEKILANSSNAIKNAIKSVNANFEKGIDGFKVEINEFGKCFETKEFNEGTSAFLNKRKPDFN